MKKRGQGIFQVLKLLQKVGVLGVDYFLLEVLLGEAEGAELVFDALEEVHQMRGFEAAFDVEVVEAVDADGAGFFLFFRGDYRGQGQGEGGQYQQ